MRTQPGRGQFYHRDEVAAQALSLLEAVGLPDLTMRRLGHQLGVQPSAIYHHFSDKQTLLAAVADTLLTRLRPVTVTGWEDGVVAVCTDLRDVLLSVRDGAELVATVWAFGLGATAPYDLLVATLKDGGVGDLAPVAARTVLHFVYGHVLDEQTRLQAAAVGAIEDAGLRDPADFATGLAIAVAGIGMARAVRQ